MCGKSNSYRKFCKVTSSGCFLKKDILVIYSTTAMLGDPLEFLCIVLKNLDNGTKYGTQKLCYFKMQQHILHCKPTHGQHKHHSVYKELQCCSSKSSNLSSTISTKQHGLEIINHSHYLLLLIFAWVFQPSNPLPGLCPLRGVSLQ